MTTTRFDQARSGIYAELETLRAKMAGRRMEFLNATAGYLGLWYQNQVRRILSENPGRFSALSDTTRSEFKSEVLRLIDDGPVTVRRFFANTEIWWDEKDPSAPRRHYDYTIQGNAMPATVDTPLRFSMGSLLPIVERHRFTASGFSIRKMEKGFDDRAPEYPFYRHRYQCSPQMLDILSSYGALHADAVAHEKELSSVDRAEARERDQLLWEQA